MTSFTSDLPIHGGREFSFNKSSRLAFFLEEDGIYFYTARSFSAIVLPSFVVAAAVALALFLYASGSITYLEFSYIYSIGVVAGIVLYIFLWLKRKKIPKGSSMSDWNQSGIKPTLYQWSTVKAKLDKRNILIMSMGSGLKRRNNAMMSCGDKNIPELKAFLSEKIGERFKAL